MAAVQEMLRTHPREAAVDLARLTECIQACYDCADACTNCADACLGEKDVSSLVRCIRLNLDCSDVCATTGKLLSRQTDPNWGLLRSQLEACIIACSVCATECESHAGHHEHCRVCAEACRRCEAACRRLLELIPG